MTEDHIRQNMRTYDEIAKHYHVTATDEVRERKERSMRDFANYMVGSRVLVPGCGDGRDSRYLTTLGLEVESFDFSDGMLSASRESDPDGKYFQLDFRDVASLPGRYDGIWASGCLYHLKKEEFRDCIANLAGLLNPGGILFVSMKQGSGEVYRDTLGENYPGGVEAERLLKGTRFYAYYSEQELLDIFRDFEILKQERFSYTGGGFEFWMRPSTSRSVGEKAVEPE